MPSLDTNVLVRYIVRDDPAQHREAARVMAEHQGVAESLFVPLTVCLELEWVLRSAYAVDKPQMLELFRQLLESRELRFQEESTIERALFLFRESRADFAACVHVAAALGYEEQPFLTFDHRASGLPGAQRLTTA